MNKLVLLTVFIFPAFYSFSQKDVSVKIYQNSDIFETQQKELTGQATKIENVNFNRFSLALAISTKKGYSHEIELFIPEISKSIEDLQFPIFYEFKKSTNLEDKASAYSLRYEVSKTLTDPTKRFAFLLGAGINPYYVNMEYFPYDVLRVYYSSTKLYGFALHATPRIKYRISHRFSVDLNVPLKVYDLRGDKATVKNPAIPSRQQTNTSHEHIFFEQAYTIRLGLNIRLDK